MGPSSKPTYRFKSFVLNVGEHLLLRDGIAVPLTPKAFSVLVYLVERASHLVEKGELMNAVWAGSFVEEGNLTRTIYELRRALGEDANGNKFIETVPTKGYRFVAQVKADDESVSEQIQAVSSDPGSKPQLSQIAGSDSRTGLWRRPVFLTIVIVIAATVISGLVLSGGAAKSGLRSLTPATFSGAALQHYTQGRFLVERRHKDKGDYEAALGEFDKAIELDPNYADAWAGRADAKTVAFWRSDGVNHDPIIQARAAANRAIELDPSNAYGYTILCRISTTYDYEHQKAETECRKALEIEPDDHEALKELGLLLSSLGRDEEALENTQRAVAAAPTSFNRRSLGRVLYFAGRYDDAIAQFRQVDKTDPDYGETATWLIASHQAKGDYPNALESYVRILERSGASANDIASVRSAFEQDGWPPVLRHMSVNVKGDMFRACVFAQLGEKDRAFEILEKMFNRRAVMLVILPREPRLAPLHDDPRFLALTKRLNFR